MTNNRKAIHLTEPNVDSTQAQLPDGFRLTLATPDDNDAILRFYSERAMSAGMSITFDRHPNYYALINAHSTDYEVWLLWHEKHLRACGYLLVRDGYLDGRSQPVVYLGDLRVSLHRRTAGRWRRFLHERLQALQHRTGARHAYCCVIRSNRQALLSLLTPRSQSASQFRHLRGYSTVSLLWRKPRFRNRREQPWQVRRATADDSEPLRQYMTEQSQQQAFGVVFDQATWQHRCKTWPNFGVEQFYLAIDVDGTIIGCAALWDSTELRRIVVKHPDSRFRRARQLYNLLAPVLKRPKLASCDPVVIPDISLSHVFIRDRNPLVFAHLLDACYNDFSLSKRYVSLSLCLYDGDPLASVLNDYWTFSTPMDLYSVALDTPPATMSATTWPGFEFYLV